MMAYWPTGITVDQDNNITLGVALGKGRVIPADEITITKIPENLLSSIIRTNGMSLGKITGKENIVCFEYDGVLYVVDDWRTNP